MKRKLILIGGGYAINAAEIRQHLATAGLDMTEVEIVAALTPADICTATELTDREIKLEAMSIAARNMPDPTPTAEIFKKDIQPRFKFQNVRNIRK